jgi:hypothetical protein
VFDTLFVVLSTVLFVAMVVVLVQMRVRCFCKAMIPMFYVIFMFFWRMASWGRG